MDVLSAVFLIAIIVLSAVVHEFMHGYAADRLGDPTARYAGRLTLNPLPHIELFGSVILPGVLVLSGSPFLFGWAKPVPYNPYNLKPGRFSEAIVAIAGPLSNLFLAVCAGLFLRLGVVSGAEPLLYTIITVNIMLFLFNLLPIPPLDGSKILSSLLPFPLSLTWQRFRDRLEFNPFLGMGLVLLVVLLFGSVLGQAVRALAGFIAGV